MMTTRCIACGSDDLRRDEHHDDAWMCNSCEYESDVWRQLRARRWKERTFLRAEFDARTRELELRFAPEDPERNETFEFDGGMLRKCFASGRCVAIEVTLERPGFEIAFLRGYRPFYDQWVAGFYCQAIEVARPLADPIDVVGDDEDDDHIWIQLDAEGALAVVGLPEGLFWDLPVPLQNLAGRMFEMDTGND